MERKYMYLAGFLAMVLICVGALYINADSEFGGADGQGGDLIEELDPTYETWWDGIFGDWSLPGETESLLFALQAAIGAVIIGYFIGRYMANKNN